jgi:diaminopimelate epimerase
LTFAKGHGTGNDFVIVPDPDGSIPLTARLVAALCDRRRGIGADGVLRVVRSSAHPAAEQYGEQAEWFMDYWNADGSHAEMCGNGVRVFIRFLVEEGLVDPDLAGSGDLLVATRSGPVRAVVGPDEVAVRLAVPRVYADTASAIVAGRRYPGSSVDVGNPHLVCRLADGVAELAALDLSTSPDVDDAAFPSGVNVEFVAAAPGVDGADVHLRMRVFERGSGETLSCGSGACAVAAVALRDAGFVTDAGLAKGTAVVDVPGGRLRIELDGDGCWLSGPALIVAHGSVDPAALNLRLASVGRSGVPSAGTSRAAARA